MALKVVVTWKLVCLTIVSEWMERGVATLDYCNFVRDFALLMLVDVSVYMYLVVSCVMVLLD